MKANPLWYVGPIPRMALYTSAIAGIEPPIQKVCSILSLVLSTLSPQLKDMPQTTISPIPHSKPVTPIATVTKLRAEISTWRHA